MSVLSGDATLEWSSPFLFIFPQRGDCGNTPRVRFHPLKILCCSSVLVLCFLTWSANMGNKICMVVCHRLVSGFAFQTEFGSILFLSNHRGLSSIWLYCAHCTFWLLYRFSVLKMYFISFFYELICWCERQVSFTQQHEDFQEMWWRSMHCRPWPLVGREWSCPDCGHKRAPDIS
jgi:hypothetical protein